MEIIKPVVESQEDQEDTINFHHYHAEIIKDSLGGEVRITVASEAAIIIFRPISTSLEALWYQLKEVFVNQIFLNSKQNKGIRIRSFILESYYNWINKARGTLTKTSLSYKVRWFLSELVVVAPNSSIIKMSQLVPSNKQRLLKQYLLTNMDTMVLTLKTIATKLKNMKSVKPEMEQLLKISESGIAQVENYSFLRHLLADLFDEEDEIIKKHIAFLDHVHTEVHTTYQEILIDGVQRHLERSGEENSSYYDILIADLQKNLKNLDKRENLLETSKNNDLEITEFINDSNGGKLEVEAKNIKILRTDKETGIEKIEDFEYFILTEIEKAVKYSEQTILQKQKENEKEKNRVKSDDIIVHFSQSQNEGDDRESEIQDVIQKDTNLPQTKSEYMKLEETSNKNTRTEKSVDHVLNNIKKLHDMAVSTDTTSARTVFDSKRQEVQKDISNTQHGKQKDLKTTFKQKDTVAGKIISTCALKDSKKSVCTNNKKKDFIEFQENSQISNVQYNTIDQNQLKHKQEYAKKFTEKKTKLETHTTKHINDEL